jgi:2-dehydropantoate 2-reductase
MSKIGIVGAGAMGGTIAADLIKAGYSPDIADINKAHRDKVNADGLLIDGALGESICTNIKIMERLEGLYDLIVLAVKSTATKTACEQIKENLNEKGVVVSLQNGVNNEIISGVLGAERLIAGVVGFGATNKGPGHITITSDEKKIVLGRPNGEVDQKLREVARILSASSETELSDNILGDQWGKMAMNCIINPFCAIYDRTFGECVKDKKIRKEMQLVVNEVITVGKRAGVNFTKLGGKIDIEKFFTIHLMQDIIDITSRAVSPTKRVLDLLEYPLDLFKGSLMLRFITLHHGKIKSSMWQDLDKGSFTEIDNLNGYVADIGKKYWVKTPVNDDVRRKIKELEKVKVKG